MIYPDSPAFARNGNEAIEPHVGISRREYFASSAMQGMVSGIWPSDIDLNEVARCSVRMADALIAELNKNQP